MKLETIYILKTYGKNDCLYKIGYTSNIKRRLEDYKSVNPFIETIDVFYIENAKSFEQDFHTKYKHLCRHRKEWYSEEILEYLYKEIEQQITKPLIYYATSLKEVIIECKKGNKEYLDWAFKKYDFLKDAIEYIGYDKLEKIRTKPSDIKKVLAKHYHKNAKKDIKLLLDQHEEIYRGAFITLKRLREIFSEIYKQLAIERIANSTDILDYHQIRKYTKRINGRATAGILLMS